MRITIARARRPYACHCGNPAHRILRGQLYMHCAEALAARSKKYERWHSDHFADLGRLIVVDKLGNEVARYGF